MTTLTEARSRDLMQKKVITLQAEDPVEDAIGTFEEYNISGAPVLDGAGKLVGVLSAHDVARSEHVRSGRIEAQRGDYYLADMDEDSEAGSFADKEDYSPDVLGRERVGDWMTQDIISVGAEASLREICDIMSTNNVHRVLVVEEDRVVGLITSFDIVRFLAHEL